MTSDCWESYSTSMIVEWWESTYNFDVKNRTFPDVKNRTFPDVISAVKNWTFLDVKNRTFPAVNTRTFLTIFFSKRRKISATIFVFFSATDVFSRRRTFFFQFLTTRRSLLWEVEWRVLFSFRQAQNNEFRQVDGRTLIEILPCSEAQIGLSLCGN